MPDTRRHLRLRQHMDVHWNLDGTDVFGGGTILNISLSGVFLQTDRVFKVADQSVMSLSFALEGQELPLTEKHGRIVWFRQVNAPEPRYQCGVEFISKEVAPDGRLEHWLKAKMTAISEAGDANILNNYVVQQNGGVTWQKPH